MTMWLSLLGFAHKTSSEISNQYQNQVSIGFMIWNEKQYVSWWNTKIGK